MRTKVYILFCFLLFISSCKASDESIPDEGTKTQRRLVVLNDTIIKYVGLNETDIELKGTSSVYFTGSNLTTIFNNSTINLLGNEGWIYFPNIEMATIKNAALSNYIMIEKAPISIDVNAEISKYYNGTLIKSKSTMYSPAVLYNNQSKAHQTTLYMLYQGSTISVGDNLLHSFTLKRGHMMTISENEDGTGVSRVYIATDKHLQITLDSELQNKISYMRILPWVYSTKRGFGGKAPASDELAMSWSYNWTMGETSSEMFEYVPMIWGKYSLGKIDDLHLKKNTTHLLSFNEPDGADQSNMTAQQALVLYPQLLKSGLRIGSPACRENAWKTWLPSFVEGCKQMNYRLDFIAIHWYDWGNWGSTQNAEPQDIDALVNRFKKNIDDCYAMYQLPVWITEFNANKNRLTNVQKLFLEKAVKMLEEHPNVERYAYFEPFGSNGKRPGHGEFFENNTLTVVGKAYRIIPSTPAIK